MQLSITGMALIKDFEGLRLKAYQDCAGVWTIGYGSTCYTNGVPVKCGDQLSCITKADELFAGTLTLYEDAVNKHVKQPLTQHQFDALVSFTYNEGVGALAGSTLVKKLNQGNVQAAADQFLVWTKVTNPHTGKKIVSTDLLKRREKERAHFLTL